MNTFSDSVVRIQFHYIINQNHRQFSWYTNITGVAPFLINIQNFCRNGFDDDSGQRWSEFKP